MQMSPPTRHSPDTRRAAPEARVPFLYRALGRLIAPWLAIRREPAPSSDVALVRPGVAVCYVLERLRPVQRADPGARLPRRRPALAAAADARGGRSAGPQALVRGAVAPQCQCAAVAGAGAGAGAQDPFRFAGAAAGGAPRRIRRWTCSWCRCRSSSAAHRTGAAAGSRVLFSENWAIVGRFRRLLAILLNGRDTMVQFAPPVSLRGIVAEDLPPERTVRKLSRVLRTHFRRIREAWSAPTCPAPHAGGQGAGRRTGARGDRRPGAARQDHCRGRPGRRRTPTPTRSPPTIRTRWCARPASC
jgi:glycerol-3-phosphate O-acyltransferase